jgi:hypothetical protein
MKWISIIFSLAIIPPAFGQAAPFKVIWGKEFTAPSSSTLGDIIGYDRSGFYVVRNQTKAFSNKLSIERFDNQLNLAKSIDLELVEDGKKSFLEYFLHLDGRLWMFTSFPDSKSKKNVLMARPVNKQSLMPDNVRKKQLLATDFGGRRAKGGFTFRTSNDSSKVLIYYSLPQQDPVDPQKFGFMILNKQMEMLWQKEIMLPYRDDLFDIESTKIDNNGNVYLLGLLFKDRRREKRKGLPNYEYKVLSYTNNGETSNEFAVNLPDKFLTDMQVGARANGDIVCAGFYSESGTLSIRGTFFLSIDAKSKEVRTKSLKEFDINFITQNMTEREMDRAKKRDGKGQEVELYEYDLDKLIVRSDGGAMLIGEQYFVRTRTYTQYMGGRPMTQTTTYYYYNDIIVVNIDPQGNIDWSVKVPKRQMSIDDGGFYSSYAMAINKDKIYFVYNDSPDNLSYTGTGTVSNASGRNRVVMVTSVNSKGEMSRKPLSGGMAEVITRPKVCEQISYSEMILFGQRRKTQQFGMITF